MARSLRLELHAVHVCAVVLLFVLLVLGAVRPLLAMEPSRRAAASASTNTHRAEPGCTKNMSRAVRLVVLNHVTTQLEDELKKSAGNLEDHATRARMGTFIAGSMSDEVPFISLDRWCWADFHQARKALIAGDEASAFEAARDWQVCLAATFPDRLPLASGYFGCFPGKRR
jgi:hypothetical protein